MCLLYNTHHHSHGISVFCEPQTKMAFDSVQSHISEQHRSILLFSNNNYYCCFNTVASYSTSCTFLYCCSMWMLCAGKSPIIFWHDNYYVNTIKYCHDTFYLWKSYHQNGLMPRSPWLYVFKHLINAFFKIMEQKQTTPCLRGVLFEYQKFQIFSVAY